MSPDRQDFDLGRCGVVRMEEILSIQDLQRQDLRIQAIAGRTGLDRKTVHKYLSRGLEPPVYGPRRAAACWSRTTIISASALTPLKPRIRASASQSARTSSLKYPDQSAVNRLAPPVGSFAIDCKIRLRPATQTCYHSRVGKMLNALRINGFRVPAIPLVRGA